MEELEKNETSTQAEENTVSLASAQALADALAKIEAYTPTTWVDNSSPDIDAEHLNNPEQAIKRVTDALNSAIDVIKDLQSQVTKNAGDITTVNNNLSNKADKTSLSSYAQKSDLPQSGRTPAIDCESNTVTEFKVTFPKAFSKAPAVIVTPYSGTPAINGVPKYAVWNVTTTGFTIRIYNDDSEERSPEFYWIAMAQS